MKRVIAAPLLVVTLCVCLVTGSLLGLSPATAAGAGSTLSDETFTGSTVADPSFVPLGDACLTGAAAGSTPPAGDSKLGPCQLTVNSPARGVTPGYLQLTDSELDRSGGVLYNKPLPAADGLQVTFDTYQYGTTTASSGGPADGIGFFLVDGSYDLTGTGAIGGALGYAQRTLDGDTPGVNGGFVGVGLDVFGNFANDQEGRGDGCAKASPYSGLVPNAVSLRGPEDLSDPTGMSGYCWLTTKALGSSQSLQGPALVKGGPNPPTGTDRKVQVTVSPAAADGSVSVSVAIDFSGGTNFTPIVQYTLPSVPPTYKFGFSASTGGDDDVHLIRLDSLTTVDPLPSLELVKQVDHTTPQPSVYLVGDTVPYDFVVTNTSADGDALEDLEIDDPNISNVDCPSSTLGPPGSPTATEVCTGDYTITAADGAAGSFTNTATASASDDGSAVNSEQSSVTVPTGADALSVVKTPSPTTVSEVGQVVTYTYTVTNRGTLPLSGVGVTDTQATAGEALATPPVCQILANPAGSCSGATTALAPGQVATFTAAYAVTQADLDAGTFRDIAVATGTDPDGTTVTSPQATATTAAAALPSLSLTKSASPSTVSAVGQTIAYTFSVTNTGNVTLDGVFVTDTQATSGETLQAPPACRARLNPTGTCSGPTTTLAPGQTATFTATYAVTQADLDAGTISDSAVAGAGVGGAITSPAATSTVSVEQAPALTVSKSASPSTVSRVGQTVTYTFTATNTGNVTLSGVGVTDTQGANGDTLTAPPTCQRLTGPVGTCSGSTATLAPGQAATFTATATVTQGDLDSGTLTDTAVASGTGPGGATVTSPGAKATVTATQSPALTVVKSADPATVSIANQRVTYTFAVTNTGNVTLSGVGVTDDQAAPAGPIATPPDCQELSGPKGTCTGPTTSLSPGQTATFTATYVVTQADLDHGDVRDTAVAAGTTPEGTSVTSPPATATVTADQAPALTASKSATPAAVSTVGQVVTYTFTVTNTGNVTLGGVAVSDTQTTPSDTLATGPSCVSLAGPAASCTGAGSTTLAPGQSATFTATAAVTQADLDHGSIGDTATAAGTTPAGATVASGPTSATVGVDETPSLAVSKSATPATVSAVGQTVTYRFVVKNTGNVTMSGVGVTDTQGTAGEALATPPTCQALVNPARTCSGSTTTLAPGRSATFVATYVVTQQDLDAGSVTDSATATGTTPGGSTATSPPSRATVIATQSPSLKVVKTASPATVSSAGQVVTYTFAVTNTGNVTLSGVGVTDTQAATGESLRTGPTCQSLADPAASCRGATTTLAPGQVATFTATSIVTQADVDNGRLSDRAVATGATPSRVRDTSPPAAASVGVDQSPSLTLVKSAAPATVSSVGQTVTYTFLVTNTGNVTLTGVGVADTAGSPADQLTTPPTCQSLARPGGTCGGPTTTLEPGQSATFTGSHVVTQADLDRGRLSDRAIAGGTAPGGGSVTSPAAPAQVGVDQSPSLTVAKSASPATVSEVGQTVSYTFLVTNTGNVTLTGVGVTDTQAATGEDLEQAPTCRSLAAPAGTCSAATTTTLAPGQHATFTALYLVTQANLDAGRISDSAVAGGTGPTGAVTSPTSTAVVDVDQSPSLVIAKSAAPVTMARAGQIITYRFSVTDTGNVTDTEVTVTDVQVAKGEKLATPPTCRSKTDPGGSCAGLSATLVPGQTAIFVATYRVTHGDITRGYLTDAATASGTGPDGTTTTSPPGGATVHPNPTPPGRSHPTSPTTTPSTTTTTAPSKPTTTGSAPPTATASPPSHEAGAPPSSLAVTGADIVGAIAAAAGLLGVGGVLVVTSRRRRKMRTRSCG